MEGVPKRFEIQQDEFAQERVVGIRSAIEALEKEYPEIVGCTLYGSLSKGRARPDSDIDMHVFLDVRQACVAQGIPEEEWSMYVSVEDKERAKNKSLDIIGIHPDTRLDHTLYAPYKALVVDALRRYIPDLSDEQVKNVSIRPMNTEYIDKICNTLEESWGAASQYAGDVQKLRVEQGGTITLEQLQTIPSRVEQLTLPPDLLYHMFHLRIGEGLRTYRDQLLKRLHGMGDIGKYIWIEIVRGLEDWEQAVGRGGGDVGIVQYPRTLTEAIQIYGSRALKDELIGVSQNESGDCMSS